MELIYLLTNFNQRITSKIITKFFKVDAEMPKLHSYIKDTFTIFYMLYGNVRILKSIKETKKFSFIIATMI